MRIEFKAYGGTGALIARSWVVLAALNTCDMSVGDPNQPGGVNHAMIYRLDFDDKNALPGTNNDYQYLENTVADYQKLHERNLGFLAPLKLDLCKEEAFKLKAIRSKAYPDEGTFSLSTIYLRNQHINEITSLLTAAFTSDPHSPEKDKELERSNLDGNYGDLAVNSFINERIIQLQPDNAYAASGIYNDLQAEIDKAIVIYAGSMDGGTANTNIDKDIHSLLLHLQKCNIPIDHNRPFRMYALRSTPYSKFKLDPKTTTKADYKITKSILDDKFEMASGVIDRISEQNQRAAATPNTQEIDQFSYYYLNPGIKYWLDGLFLGCSNTLDETMDKALKDGQFHPSHLVEFALAEQAMDAIAGRLPVDNRPHLYAYNDGGSNATMVTLKSFFGHIKVHYQLKHATYFCSMFNGNEFQLDHYIYAYLLTLITIRGQMIQDFENCQGGPSKEYIAHLFNVGSLGVKCSPDLPLVAPFVANELKAFLKESKFIVDALVNIMQYSQFGLANPVEFGSKLLANLYDTDFREKPNNRTSALSIIQDAANHFQIVEEAAQATTFLQLDMMHEFVFKANKPKNLKQEKFYMNYVTGDQAQRGKMIAHTMIERMFEIYLVQMS